ncbi:MAG: alpha/beta fold hydrolase [Gammaproteobacteria bacterium]|nr:alpha/beta fold hydrolase [Gammaproteobacteria bacterium]MBQ0839480.1 alpha/beta fold hydrolase [Gammaproteobacteria bacterium]
MAGWLVKGFSHRRLTDFLLVKALLLSLFSFADPVQINLAELRLNANLMAVEDRQKTAFLIVHGTWAHGAMELPVTLQSLLDDEGYASLAITLSLGINNRRGFFDCKSPIVQSHEAAVEEIHAWYLFMREQGYSKVVLIAHSRGGAQAALYQQSYPQDELAALVLIAPMTWREDLEAKAYKEKFGLELHGLLAAAEQYRQEGRALFTPPGLLYCEKTAASPAAFMSYYSSIPKKNTPALLQKINIPTVVYLASQDPLSESFAEQQALLVEKKNIFIVTIDGAGHFFRDLYSDELIEDLLPRLP